MPAFCNADRFLALHLTQMQSHTMLSGQSMVSGGGKTPGQSAVASQTVQQFKGRAANPQNPNVHVPGIFVRTVKQVSHKKEVGHFESLANYLAQLFGILSKKPSGAGGPDFEKGSIAEGEQVMAKIVMTCHSSGLELSSGKFEVQVQEVFKEWQGAEKGNLLFWLRTFLQKLNSRKDSKNNASAIFFRRIADICLSESSSRKKTGSGAGCNVMPHQKFGAGYGKIAPDAQAEERLVLGLPHVEKNGYEDGTLPLGAIALFFAMNSADQVDKSVALCPSGKSSVPIRDFPDVTQFDG
jgi:hypothetical protein